MSKNKVQQEYILEALRSTAKKITDLKEFNIPIIMTTIKEYEEAGVEDSFIEQQRAQLKRVYERIAELENKARRLLEHLE